MSESCEIVEELVVATSECPATDIIAVQLAAAVTASSVYPGVTHPPVVDVAAALSQAIDGAYTPLDTAAHATELAFPSLAITGLLRSTAVGRAVPFAAFDWLAVSSASASGVVASMDVPFLLLSAAQGSSSVVVGTVATIESTTTANSTSTALHGLLETLTSTAQAVAVETLLRRVDQLASSSASAADTAEASGEPQAFLLISSGVSTSTSLVQGVHQLLLETDALVSADVWYKDPARVAWLMNTETTASSWYDNFDFESIAQPPGKVLAVGPDGLYELAGGTDSGEQIDAKVVSGFYDFGTPQTKRVDGMYFGYTSDGRISVTVATYESGHAPAIYFLEQRAAGAPRNSRVVPGKGLFGRYWRMTIRNVDGAEFEIHDASVDLAVSPRRV